MNFRILILLLLFINWPQASALLAAADDVVIAIHTGYLPAGETGPHDGPWYWNRIGTWGEVEGVALKDSQNADTSIRWSTVRRFSFHFRSSVIDTSEEEQTSDTYPFRVLSRGYYVAPRETIGHSGPFLNAEVLLDGTDPSKQYKFTFIGTRIEGMASDFALHVSASGKTSASETLLVPADENASAEISITGISPNEAGEITLLFSVPDGYLRGTINAVVISTTP